MDVENSNEKKTTVFDYIFVFIDVFFLIYLFLITFQKDAGNEDAAANIIGVAWGIFGIFLSDRFILKGRYCFEWFNFLVYLFALLVYFY